MFERFTDRARRCLILSQEAARLRNNVEITTAHLLYGLVAEGEGVAAKTLINLGVHELDVLDAIPKGTSLGHGSPPFTVAAKKSLENALREALALGHNYIGTEHMLLGLLRDNFANNADQTMAIDVLTGLGLSAPNVRGEVLDFLRGYQAAPPTPPAPPRYLELDREVGAIRVGDEIDLGVDEWEEVTEHRATTNDEYLNNNGAAYVVNGWFLRNGDRLTVRVSS